MNFFKIMMVVMLYSTMGAASLSIEYACKLDESHMSAPADFRIVVDPSGSRLIGLLGEVEGYDLRNVAQFKFAQRGKLSEVFVWYQPTGVGQNGFIIDAKGKRTLTGEYKNTFYSQDLKMETLSKAPITCELIP